MKTELIRFGTPCSYDKKYMNGKVGMRVLVLEGTPEDVAAAKALRYHKLNVCAVTLHDFFTSSFSARMLDQRFAAEKVLNLSELIRKVVTDRNIYLLSLTSARKILEAEEKHLLYDPESM